MAKKNELYCTFFINDIQEVSFFTMWIMTTPDLM